MTRNQGLLESSDRIRTGDGGFVIRCLSHLATEPFYNKSYSLSYLCRWLLYSALKEAGLKNSLRLIPSSMYVYPSENNRCLWQNSAKLVLLDF